MQMWKSFYHIKRKIINLLTDCVEGKPNIGCSSFNRLCGYLFLSMSILLHSEIFPSCCMDSRFQMHSCQNVQACVATQICHFYVEEGEPLNFSVWACESRSQLSVFFMHKHRCMVCIRQAELLKSVFASTSDFHMAEQCH